MNEIQTKQRIMRSSPKNDLVWSDEIPEVPSLDARDDDFLSVDYSTATQVSTNNGRVTERHETEMMLRKRLDVVRSSRPSKTIGGVASKERTGVSGKWRKRSRHCETS